ncbi:MAG: DUF2007 domain-containing protein [Spirochaetales bacterium]|nr:DUF2007 domain-containing protein [Spirochaetales bacterium]
MQTRLVYETTEPFKGDMVEALLKSAGIPYERKSFGMGPAMTIVYGQGLSSGIRFFVPEDDFGRARECLEGAGF